MTQNWYDSTEIFSVSHFAILVTQDILTGSIVFFFFFFFFNFETNKCKNHFDTNLIKIHLAVIEIRSFSSFVIF